MKKVLIEVLIKVNLLHHKTATCTRDIISNAPTVNTSNRRDVLHVLITSLTSECLPIYNFDK